MKGLVPFGGVKLHSITRVVYIVIPAGEPLFPFLLVGGISKINVHIKSMAHLPLKNVDEKCYGRVAQFSSGVGIARSHSSYPKHDS